MAGGGREQIVVRATGIVASANTNVMVKTKVPMIVRRTMEVGKSHAGPILGSHTGIKIGMSFTIHVQ